MLHRIQVAYIHSDGAARYGIDVYGHTVHDLNALIWPLILHWRRQLKKYPDAEVSLRYKDLGIGCRLKHIKADQIHRWMMERINHRAAA